jgi:hypothetical protein
MPKFQSIDTDPFTVTGFKVEDIYTKLKEWGVVVIKDVYSRDQCSNFLMDYVPRIKTVLNNMNTPKPGQHKDIICHDKALWNFRNDVRLEALYSYLYAKFHDKQNYPIVLSSIDGVNIKDPTTSPYFNDQKPDWAHLDQTNGDLWDCIQGQIVLSDTSAGFVCSPKSHLVYRQVMDIMHVLPTNRTNWCVISGKATKQQEKMIIDTINSVGGTWQGYIYVPPGSVILWLSTTIHSAKIADKPPKNMLNQNPVKLLKELTGWRAVIYLCYIMSDTMTPEQKELRWSAMTNNRSMNHWCTAIWDNYLAPSYNKDMMDLLKDPTSWKHFDSQFIQSIIMNEKNKIDSPDKYHMMIQNQLDSFIV